ncbi:MAG: hypothetical protein GQ544_05665, partial [Candidatus Aminicenantes bacterium]|nr:hypothetical protein [Candidatus Aminicenantes bacterium]
TLNELTAYNIDPESHSLSSRPTRYTMPSLRRCSVGDRLWLPTRSKRI